ncbi:hypothetical protein LZ086_07625 [Acinetobacter johnsonii]|nr:hypothetical protein LZ086_07625 [Acinetobacter johnsonii]
MLNDLIEMCKERLGSYEKLSWKLEIAPTVISDWKARRKTQRFSSHANG